MDYKKETRSAYQNLAKAVSYKKQIAEKLTWARFAMWREKRIIKKALRRCRIKMTDLLLDIPCGTGVLASVLGSASDIIIASDISREMMDFAREEYRGIPVRGFIQADITATPFKPGSFRCVVVLGFMHRVPSEIRIKTLREMASVSDESIIVSYSVVSALQRCKRSLMKRLFASYKSAPSSAALQEILQELSAQGWMVVKKYQVVPFLSSEFVFVLKKMKASRSLGG